MAQLRKFLAVFSVSMIGILAQSAHAQATRTWVSGVGDDANPCSRTAPCKTFAGAISKTAAGGEIDVLDPGGFGALTITKAITIDGTPVVAGVLVAGTAGIVVNAGTTDVVTLRGLDFNGSGGGTPGTRGIQIIQAGKVLIEDCQVFEFSPRGISVEPSSSPVQVFISNTRIQGSLSNGIVVQPASPSIRAAVTLNNVEIVENANFGLSITGGSSVVVRNSVISDNGWSTTFTNIRADALGGTTTLDLDNVIVGGSNVGIFSLNGAVVRVNNSSIVNNVTGLSQSGGTILSFGNNRLVGNSVNGSFNGTIGLQ
jgi:hypothetical protein